MVVWQHNKPASTADVGMMYVQSGMRWIPNYLEGTVMSEVDC